MKKWRCTVCGYIHNGDEPPEKCPVCGADKSLFEEIIEDAQTQEQDSKQSDDKTPQAPGASPGMDLGPWLELVHVRGVVVEAPPLEDQVCTDPDDDKFLACARAARVKLIVSGDKALLRASGYSGIAVLTPRRFVDQYLG